MSESAGGDSYQCSANAELFFIATLYVASCPLRHMEVNCMGLLSGSVLEEWRKRRPFRFCDNVKTILWLL